MKTPKKQEKKDVIKFIEYCEYKDEFGQIWIAKIKEMKKSLWNDSKGFGLWNWGHGLSFMTKKQKQEKKKVLPKISDLIEQQKTLYTFGSFTIKTGIDGDRLWLENSIGEGGDFPTKDILELLMPKLSPETIEEKLEEYFNDNF